MKQREIAQLAQRQFVQSDKIKSLPVYTNTQYNVSFNKLLNFIIHSGVYNLFY